MVLRPVKPNSARPKDLRVRLQGRWVLHHIASQTTSWSKRPRAICAGRRLWHPAAQMLQALWKRAMRLRFRLIDSRCYRTTPLEMIAGQPILALFGVFNPKSFWTEELSACAIV
jgi:hypothetical protein